MKVCQAFSYKVLSAAVLLMAMCGTACTACCLLAEDAGLALHNVLRRAVYMLGQRSWDVPGRFVSGAEHHDALRQRMPVWGVGV